MGSVDCLERIWKAHNKVFCGYLSVAQANSCVGVRYAMIGVVYLLLSYRKLDLLSDCCRDYTCEPVAARHGTY